MYYLISYTLFYVLGTQFREKQSSIVILPLSPRTVFFDLALWRHYSWSVTSRELALWRQIRRLFLHVQTGTKAIFTSE